MSVFSSARNEDVSPLDRPLPPAPSSSSHTVVARGVRIEGDFHGQGDIVVEGEVEGNIKTTGMLTIGPEAKVNADIEAERAVIAGMIEGDVVVKSHLEMKSTAHVLGNVTCATAAIESGGTLKGVVAIGSDADAQSSKTVEPQKAEQADVDEKKNEEEEEGESSSAE